MVRRGRHPRRHCEEPATWQSGVGSRPLVGVWGVSASAQGASRGDRPLWQEVWRVSLQSFTNLPPSFQEGGRGMVPYYLRDQQQLADALTALERPVRLGCLR